MTPDECAAKLRWFAEHGTRGHSPLYEHLCAQAAGDEQLLHILQHTPGGQPVPNLFLAAVHFLLLSGMKHDLAAFYPSCTAVAGPPGDAFPAFRSFCLTHECRIRSLMARRRVQTNEVRRCAYLLPAFTHVARSAAARPLALIEVGASAGLNLIWDRYGYDYGAGRVIGNPEAKVCITAKIQGGRTPPLPAQPPAVAHRTGVDLHVPNLAQADEALWLRALIWPDQPQRMHLLTAAMDQLRADPPPLIEADALEALPALIKAASRDATLCIFHCHTLNQFSSRQRQAFDTLLADASRQRPIVQLSAEWIATPSPQLWLFHWTAGERRGEHLADVDQHGRWIQWLLE